MTRFIYSNQQFENEFRRCCKKYEKLEMFIAWIGDPQNIVPFEYLYSLKKIKAVVGIAFCQSHPDGIKLLMDLSNEVRIANEDTLFHPKIYIFSNTHQRAIFIGSSNFTYQGFYRNIEANVLIEGTKKDKALIEFEKCVQKWRAKESSFEPDEQWLKKYSVRYYKRRQKLKESKVEDESNKEDEANGVISWLSSANWNSYITQIKSELRKSSLGYNESLRRKLGLFHKSTKLLSLPWNLAYFNDIEKRRLIGGMDPTKDAPESYGWLGHVAASGDFRKILANGTKNEHAAIVKAINRIGELSHPVDWKKLRASLKILVHLGPTMKVWGRVLAITRPDLFCTISSPHVRKKIATQFGKSEKFLEDVDGYLMVIRMIHESPWFNSEAPLRGDVLEIWKRRVAFLDVVFYN